MTVDRREVRRMGRGREGMEGRVGKRREGREGRVGKRRGGGRDPEELLSESSQLVGSAGQS